MLQFILWDVSPQIFQIGGFELRWYGILFATGFIIGQYILAEWYKKEGKNPKDVEAITIYTVVATIIGARLGHCLFYEPDYYLSNPVEILKVWKGGLASHGAAVGILIGLYLYARSRADQSYLYVLDRVVILVALGGGFIRFGNLMNSEIIGHQSDKPWAMVFTDNAENKLENYFTYYIDEAEITSIKNGAQNGPYESLMLKMRFKVPIENESEAEKFAHIDFPAAFESYESLSQFILPDTTSNTVILSNDKMEVSFPIIGIARHPTQIYESFSYFVIAAILFLAFYKPSRGNPIEGKIFSVFLVLLFGIRFFHEYLKENQVDFEDGLALNMGQILSIPLVTAGVILFFYVQNKSKKEQN